MRVLTSQSIFWYDYVVLVVFFKQKTAYEMRISDWSSDVCSSDLRCLLAGSRPPRIGSSNTTSATTTINAAKPINSGITMHPPIRACLPYWRKIGRAHVCTPVNNAHLVCRLLIEQKNIMNNMYIGNLN